MNFLPKELEDIIINYKLDLEYKTVEIIKKKLLNELENLIESTEEHLEQDAILLQVTEQDYYRYIRDDNISKYLLNELTY